MNREEATQWLEQIKNFLIYGGDEKFDERRKEAIDMAIQALEQETHDKGTGTHACVCEDAISRQAVIDLCKSLIDKSDLVDVAYEVRRLPSVQPMRKRGKWIPHEVELPDRKILNYTCSVCGRKLVGYNTETLKDAPFCHCGSDNREDGE